MLLRAGRGTEKKFKKKINEKGKRDSIEHLENTSNS